MRRLVRLVLVVYLLFVLLPCTVHPRMAREVWSQMTGRASEAGSDIAAWVTEGETALSVRLERIQEAKHSILLSSYIYGMEESGKMVSSALMQAADRGVQVRIIADGLISGLHLHGTPEAYALGSHPNIELRFYNPVNLLDPAGLNARYHEKYMIVDDEWLLLGGRNVSDEFLIPSQTGYNIDLEALVHRTGSGVSACDLARERFEETWESGWCTQVYDAVPQRRQAATEAALERMTGERWPDTAQTEKLAFHPVQSAHLLVSHLDPHERTAEVLYGLMDYLVSAEETVTLCSPYFVMDRAMQKALKLAADKPSAMTLITNSAATGNNVIASSDALFHGSMLTSLEAEIYQAQREYSVHTKAASIDHRLSIVGSFNMDMRSAYLDTEMMLVLESPELTAELERYLEGLLVNAIPVGEHMQVSEIPEKVEIPPVKKVRLYFVAPIVYLIRYLV
ncbi:MAG: phosphatidylserine/phosphatidylglycerophosphate/cardiolipin synthase family protein [Clostridia bacterium]|nr:phosphatidylserine/phosphatidylglycerophosphate/cardiolipin synthase family protein [Clostridia bacterium]